MNLFGSRKPKTEAKDAILLLNDKIEELDKKIAYLQCKADSELADAKANATTNKKAALNCLKRKKQYLDQIDKLSGMQLNLEQQKLSLDNAQVMKEVVSVMATTAKVLGDLNKPKDIENVEKILDNVMEQTDQVEHVTEILSRPMTTGSYVDDDELAAELDMLEQEHIDQKLLSTSSVPLQINTPSVLVQKDAIAISAPAVPTHVPTSRVTVPLATPAAGAGKATEASEDDELAQLKAAMLLN